MTLSPSSSGQIPPGLLFRYKSRRVKEYVERFWNLHLARRNHLVILSELFVGLNQFLEECGVDHWVNFGTLLGFHRQGGLLGHDMDVDMGCLEKDAATIWDARHRLPHGWTLYDTSFSHHGPKFYVSHKGFDGDIYFYREQGDSLRSLEKTHWQNYNRPIPRDLVLPTRVWNVESNSEAVKGFSEASRQESQRHVPAQPRIPSQFRVPAQVEAYLTHIYGNLSADAKRDPATGFWV